MFNSPVPQSIASTSFDDHTPVSMTPSTSSPMMPMRVTTPQPLQQQMLITTSTPMQSNANTPISIAPIMQVNSTKPSIMLASSSTILSPIVPSSAPIPMDVDDTCSVTNSIANSTPPASSNSSIENNLPIEDVNSSAAAAANAAAINEAKEKLKLEKKERHATKKLIKELAVCKTMLEGMEVAYNNI